MPTLTSVTKYFPSAKEGFTTTLNGTISSGAATVVLNSISGYTNGDTIVLVVDPTDDSKKQTFTGVVDTAGVQITGVVWTEGTNQTHTTGSTVVDYATATHMSMVTKGLLKDHNQSGYHKTLNDDNGNEWIKQTSTASAVNEITVGNAATGNNPTITPTGGDSNVGLDITPKGTGTVNIKGNSTQAGTLRFYEDTDDGSNYSSFKAVAQSGNIDYTLPASVGSSGYFLQNNGSGALTWAAGVSGSMTLLKAGSGTHNTNGATNVDTIAITGLTALDSLLIEITFSPVTTAVIGSAIYSTTDSTALQSLYQGGSSIAAGKTYAGTVTVRKDPTSNTSYISKEVADIATSVGGSSAGIGGLVTVSGMATVWTGSWTLALRLGATTNTCPWAWAVYKIAGQ